jgi:nucleotide-binding universal stress UspA family protein
MSREPDNVILCGFTDTDAGRSAARRAAELADRLDAALVLLAAIDVPGAAAESLSGRQHKQGTLRALQAIARELDVGRGLTLRVAFGDPVDLLAAEAMRTAAAMVVVGSRPRRLRRTKLRCTVARRLTRLSPIPVVVAPPRVAATATNHGV